mgnify:CR=1 FL=1
MSERRKWTRKEEIIVLKLYCEIPFKNSSKSHPKVTEVAKLINRSPSSVNMKIGNFGSFDIALKQKGIKGLTNASKLDEEIWNEFNNKWDRLTYESEYIRENLIKANADSNIDIPKGKERLSVIRQRVNQSFFRNAVLSSYNNCCCITGLSTSQLLVASHIKPWSESDDSEKTNPTNGLCLNGLHDKAFDRGFITVDERYVIHISDDITDVIDGSAVDRYFKYYDGEKIILPDRFLPSRKYLQYHNDVIFESWK